MLAYPHSANSLSFLIILIWACAPTVFASRNPIGAPNNISARATPDNPSSREVWISSHEDFCLFAPPEGSVRISQSQRNVVSWCSKPDHGTRTIPSGAVQGVTYIRAQNWVQVSGVGDLTKLNIEPGDYGGQFDYQANKPDGAVVHGADGRDGSSWVTMISADTFCFRVCTGDAAFCPTDMADKGCYVLLSEGVGFSGTFQSCTSDDGQPPSRQGPHAPEWKNCRSDSPPAGDPSAPAGQSQGQAPAAGSASTSWIPVQTCVPCPDATSSSTVSNQPSSSSSTWSTPPSSTTPPPGTQQQPVTQVSSSDVVQQAGVIKLDALTPPPRGGMIQKRDEQTTTSNGQCCFTTWTPSVVGAEATSTTMASTVSTPPVTSTAPAIFGNSAHSAASSGQASGLITNSSSTNSGLPSRVASASASPSGSMKPGNTSAGGNGTGGNESSWAFARIQAANVNGLMSWSAIAGIMGGIWITLGGYTLL